MHVDEVVARLKAGWGISRAGSRIQANVDRAMGLSLRAGRLVMEGRFLSVPGAEVRIRDRSQAGSPGLRRPDALPPQELRAAALGIVGANFGAREDEIVQGAARALGFKVVGAQLREVIHLAVEALVEAGEVSREGDLLILPKPTAGGEPTVEVGPTMH